MNWTAVLAAVGRLLRGRRRRRK